MIYDDEDVKYEFKIILVGESGVGKTCIIKYFINNAFKQNETLSISCEYYKKVMELNELEGTKILFKIWDTVGQERYRSVSKLFYKNAKAAIFVYDITNKDSFQKIKDFWYDQLSEFSPNNKNLFYFNY